MWLVQHPPAGLPDDARVRNATVPWARPGTDVLLDLAKVLARWDRRDEHGASRRGEAALR